MHRSATRSTRRSNPRRALLGSLIGLALFGVSAVPARATMYQKVEAYSGSHDYGASELCGHGVLVDDVVTFSGKFMIRAGTGDLAGAFFGHDQSSYTVTYTNVTAGSPSAGKFFTLSGSSLTQDVRATHLYGSTFQFVSHQVGQPYVVRDMAGRVVLRDRGAITQTYLFDTGGDNVPGGTPGDTISLRVSGPHPGFFLNSDQQCEGLLSLIG